ncbi:MAG: hypothetical protein L0I24_08595 [Pseudonocardia sp.]|nr:hypothetical protein [Pseudonocardia sp.]
MPTAPTLHGLLTRLIDLADPARPPHPGGRPCGDLCVPACTATDDGDPENGSPTTAW